MTHWLELNGDPRGSDPYRLVDWIELIPFGETRNYVQRVLEGRGMYRVALGQPALPAARSAARETPLTPARSRLHDWAGAGWIGACVFDAYGTLLDVTSPVAGEAARWARARASSRHCGGASSWSIHGCGR